MPTNVTVTAEAATESSFTLRKPTYSYLHIELVELQGQVHRVKPGIQPAVLDEITLKSQLTSALQQYLGLTGAAIPIDVLKVEQGKPEAWIRLPADDESAVVAALSQWTNPVKNTAIRILSRGSWLGGMVANPSTDAKLWTLET